MTTAKLGSLEGDRGRLRDLVEALGHDIAAMRLTADEQGALVSTRAQTEQLSQNWGALVKILALGPAPETRECPACGEVGMRAATICGFCWGKLEPPQAEAR